MTELKYFIIVRLFKGWKDRLDLFGSCRDVYRSMRVEINPMDITLESNSDYIKWYLLHQQYPFDTFQNEKLPELMENLPFDILLKKDLSRSDMLELKSRLHTAIYSDEVDEDNVTLDDKEPTYNEWMTKYKEVLEEFTNLSNIPNPDFDITNPILE